MRRAETPPGAWSRKPGRPGASEGAHAELSCSGSLKTLGRGERAQQAARLDLDRCLLQLCSGCPATARSPLPAGPRLIPPLLQAESPMIQAGFCSGAVGLRVLIPLR